MSDELEQEGVLDQRSFDRRLAERASDPTLAEPSDPGEPGSVQRKSWVARTSSATEQAAQEALANRGRSISADIAGSRVVVDEGLETPEIPDPERERAEAAEAEAAELGAELDDALEELDDFDDADLEDEVREAMESASEQDEIYEALIKAQTVLDAAKYGEVVSDWLDDNLVDEEEVKLAQRGLAFAEAERKLKELEQQQAEATIAAVSAYKGALETEAKKLGLDNDPRRLEDFAGQMEQAAESFGIEWPNDPKGIEETTRYLSGVVQEAHRELRHAEFRNELIHGSGASNDKGLSIGGQPASPELWESSQLNWDEVARRADARMAPRGRVTRQGIVTAGKRESGWSVDGQPTDLAGVDAAQERLRRQQLRAKGIRA
ncbi:MAG: hypothetical protein M3N29_00835 [Chloroflexota bacterium]|nr:hypothetical protein [Chloroflexota bacterium]